LRSVRFAELLLTLVMSPERAASTAGDLTEASKSPFRFWVAVLETTAASCWKTITTNPRQIGELSGRVFLKFVRLQLWFTMLLFGAILATLIVKNTAGATWMLWLPGAMELIGRSVLLPYMLGRWISQREPRYAVAASVTFYGAMLLLSVLSLVMGWSFVAPSGIRMEVWTMLLPLPGFAFTLIGAVRQSWNELQAD
jgi:hypothetical protein